MARLGGGGAQAEAVLNKRIRGTPLVLVRDLKKHTRVCGGCAVGFRRGHVTSLTGMLMSELLISDWVVELLED